jgi:succinyl-CoA synthetase beta subunit
MNLHEYQAKLLFADYDLPVSQGRCCQSTKEAVEAMSDLKTLNYVAKCQVHAGGRGKAGGVALISSAIELQTFCDRWFGQRMVTAQTDAGGQPVSKILLESATDIAKELYLGAVIDRSAERVVFMASTEGGVDIEEVAEKTPELIHKVAIDPMVGAQPYQGRELAFKLNLMGEQIQQFTHIFMQLSKMFTEQDLALLEINPLVITPKGKLHCLDAKVNIDGNALYRHAKLRQWYDPTQEDSREREAQTWDLNYVALEGNVGCMVNGAGLAMATMDIVKLHGGAPANFLDVGGSATENRVVEAFKIILSDTNVKAILVNIFGGIVRCDMIADGIINAIRNAEVSVPVIVRL